MEPKSPENFKQMAHQIDMPESFYFVKDQNGQTISGLFRLTEDVTLSAARTDRVQNIARFFYALNDYKKTINISENDIRIQRERKRLDRGVFHKRVIQTDESGNSKLVRDKLYGNKSYEAHTYTYRKAGRDEFPKFLDQKLEEEVHELYNVINQKNEQGEGLSDLELKLKQIEELGDIYEVLDEIMNIHNIKIEDVNSKVFAWETVGKIIESQPKKYNRIN